MLSPEVARVPARGHGVPTAVAMWCAGPTLKTIFGPNFEPTFQDEASVEKAPQSGPASGTGAGH